MTEERKRQIIEGQIEVLVGFNEGCEPEQVRLNSETIIMLLESLSPLNKVSFE